MATNPPLISIYHYIVVAVVNYVVVRNMRLGPIYVICKGGLIHTFIFISHPLNLSLVSLYSLLLSLYILFPTRLVVTLEMKIGSIDREIFQCSRHTRRYITCLYVNGWICVLKD